MMKSVMLLGMLFVIVLMMNNLYMSTLITFLFEMNFNLMNYIFSLSVLIISIILMFYSRYYLKEDKNFSYFSKTLLLFVLFMVTFIFSDSLVMLYFSWDGLGVTSFLLVSFYQNIKSSQSGMVTILSNRLGDYFFIILLLMMFFNMKSFNLNLNLITIMFLMLMLLFFSKSAIFPFSTWLLFAMSAPTPVSALVHSSTLVTAGLFLSMKFNSYIYMFNNNLFFFSLFTFMYSSLMSLYEKDMKKIIALSTLNQMSFMFFTLSVNLMIFAFFQMITHAFFKSLLFSAVGILIHMNYSQQDFRSMNKNFIYNKLMLFVSLSSMCGFLMLAGFFSKDMILEKLLFLNKSIVLIFIIYYFTFYSLFYSMKLFLLQINLKSSNTFFYNLKNNNFLLLSILMIMSMVAGKLIFNNYFKEMLIYLNFINFMFLFNILILSIFLFSNSNFKFLYFLNESLFLLNYVTFYGNKVTFSLKYLYKSYFEKSFLEMTENVVFLNKFFTMKMYNYKNTYFITLILMIFMILLFLF